MHINEGKKLPLISIVIPVYNGSNYLHHAIDSALEQTYLNNEIIVIDDGSCDGGVTENIAKSYGDRIKYIKKVNGGVASALNAGIREMSGDYFSWLSHDDVYYSDKLSAQIAYLYKFNKPMVLYSDYDVIDARSNVVKRAMIPPCKPEDFRRTLIIDNLIQGCSALVPRECFERVGLFDENLRTTQDYDMWFRIAKYYDFVQMDSCLLQSREHPEQGTISMTRIHVRECNEFLFKSLITLLKEDSNSTARQLQAFIAQCISSFLARGFRGAAHAALVMYIKSMLKNKLTGEQDSLKPIFAYLNFILRRIKSAMIR